jgi:hypothetical protein
MTDITLTAAQINKVTDEHCTEPPVEPPVDPPVEPPVDPPVEPPIDPPVPPTNLYSIYFADIWGRKLTTQRQFYSNTNILNRQRDGTSVAIRLPAMDQKYELRIWAVETTNTSPGTYGVFSWRRDFNEPYIDKHGWGQGGSVSAILTPEDSLRTLYFNHQIARISARYAPWWSTLQCMFDKT